jgi:hypothetical protein
MRLVTLFLIAAFAASTVGAASYQKTDGTIVDPILREPLSLYPSGHPDGNIHSYSGANLEPDAFLTGADLNGANLNGADLTNADLSNADLTLAFLSGADLSNADLTGADLTSAFLYRADLSGTDLLAANLTGSILISALYWGYGNWTDAYYYTDKEPHWDSGMTAAWRDSWGILAIDPTSGDFNSDGVFDAADYTVWRDNLDAGWTWEDRIDYRTWKDHFGQSIASGSGADPIPEPTTLLLALLALVAAPLRVRCG